MMVKDDKSRGRQILIDKAAAVFRVDSYYVLTLDPGVPETPVLTCRPHDVPTSATVTS